MQEYKHSGKVSIWGFVALILVPLPGAMLIGCASYAVSRVYYLMILFPICMGILGMLVIHRVIKTSKVRNPSIVGLFAVIMGLMIYGAYQYAEYFVFRNDIIRSIEEDYQVDRASAAYGFSSIMEEETGATGLVGFLILKAKTEKHSPDRS